MLDQVASLWSKLQAREALLYLPALALVLAAGTLTHRAGVPLLAAATLRPTPAVTSLLVLVFAWSAYASLRRDQRCAPRD